MRSSPSMANCMAQNTKLLLGKSNGNNNSHKSNKHNLDKPIVVFIFAQSLLLFHFSFCLLIILAFTLSLVYAQCTNSAVVFRAYLNDFSTVEIIVERPLFSIQFTEPSSCRGWNHKSHWKSGNCNSTHSICARELVKLHVRAVTHWAICSIEQKFQNYIKHLIY